MKFRLEIDTANEAFDYMRAGEIYRILLALADKINAEPDRIKPGMKMKLLDLNGNSVGLAQVNTK